MKEKGVIKEIILFNQRRDLSRLLKRNIEVPVNTGKIVSITGVRRCGKTYLMLLAIKELRLKKVDKKNIVFINFEDERLKLKTEELDLILQSYRELFPKIDLKNVYFFFDEIQNLNGWEKFIRRIYDNVSKNIFITGSNSKMLSSDIATALRGRNINIELFPLSFDEYLSFKKIEPELYFPETRAAVINAFNSYLISGGFPEILNTKFSQKILQDYYYVMLYKDLIERYNIGNIPALKYFLNRLVVNLGKPSSVHKIYNELKSAGYKVSKDSLYQFADYAEAIYLSFRIPKFDFSLIKREQSERKIYFIDNGLINSLTYQFSDNYGMMLENMLYLHLRQQYGHSVFFYKDKTECDFVIMDKDRPEQVIQVCYDITDINTFKRELRGLENAALNFKLKKGTIVTYDDEMDNFFTENKIEVEVIPAYKYLLNLSST